MSYTGADRAWAEWIAWALEEESYQVLFQAWDFPPGSNWIHRMHSAIRDATRTIAILSAAYLNSTYGSAEWQAAWAQDPDGTGNRLLTVRVSDCERRGLLAGVVGIDLYGIDEKTARGRLLEMVSSVTAGRAKPTMAPRFPGTDRTTPNEPPFPGGAPPDEDSSPPRESPALERSEHSVARLSDFRRRRAQTAADTPDAGHFCDLIAGFLESTGRVAASYSAGGGEYTWLRFGLKEQLASVASALEQITEWLERTGMTDDLTASDLRHRLRLYPGTAAGFVRALDNLASRPGTAERRILLGDYRSAERALSDLLRRIHREFDAALLHDGPSGLR